MNTPSVAWHDSRQSVVRLAEWMWTTGRFNSVAELFYMLNNPGKYNAAWSEFLRQLQAERQLRLMPEMATCGD